MRDKVLITTIFLTLITVFSASAQEKQTTNTVKLSAGASGGKGQISDMAWLAGTWQGSGLGGVSEEVWSAPQGGIMMGMYRMLKDGKPVFYEFLTLSESEGGLLIRLKHFQANFVGWEEKDKTVDFRFIRKDGNRVYFEGLTWEMVSPLELNVYLAIENKKDGSVREEIFRYKRVNPK